MHGCVEGLSDPGSSEIVEQNLLLHEGSGVWYFLHNNDAGVRPASFFEDGHRDTSAPNGTLKTKTATMLAQFNPYFLGVNSGEKVFPGGSSGLNAIWYASDVQALTSASFSISCSALSIPTLGDLAARLTCRPRLPNFALAPRLLL